jgi:peptidoglycan/xylan/chitin deacetylase (PgdA/CDA1 family)
MIALWSEDLYWQELLGQEGVSFKSGPQLTGQDVTILNREPAEMHAQRIWHHIQSGGVLLASGVHAAEVWFELRPVARRLRWIADEGDSSLFRNVGIVDVESRGALLPNANAGTTDSGAKAILATKAGLGFCILLPFDVTRALTGVASAAKQFPADMPRFPYDTMARSSRGEVRRLVANSLRFLLAHKGLPYVHLASVPGRATSTFAFRVDTDFGPRRDLEAVARLADRVGMKFSWYVNVGAHKAHLDLFSDLARQGHDIQLHCLRHTVYPDCKRNLENFRRGKDAMADAGIAPVGVVAPYGEWNQNLNRAFEELGFEYSSEFCLAYDDLPFRPVMKERENRELRRGKHGSDSPVHSSLFTLRPSRVLQVPVHPICLGRLVAARANEKQMAAYFRSVIDLQVARREPCFLYDHPERIAQFGDLLADVLEYGKERCGSVTTMTEYARWWQHRERCKWSATVSGKTLQVDTQSDDSSLSVIAEQDGRFAALPAGSGEYSLSEVNWRPLPEPIRFDPNALLTRKPSVLLRAKSLHRRVRKNLQGHRG